MDNVSAAIQAMRADHVLCLIAVSVITRLLPRLFCPEARGKDAFYHLHAARTIRNNRFRLPRRIEAYLLPGIYDYPPLFHYLWALFPVKWHPLVETASSAVLDALHAVTVYFTACYCLAAAGGPGDSGSISFLIPVLFLLSPALTSVGTGPRAYQGTPRTLGELLFMLSMTAFLIYVFENMMIFQVAAGLFGACLFLTSKFGVQVFLFFHLVFFLYFRQPAWLLTPAMSVVLSLLLSAGHYREVAAGHLAHIQYYRKAISKRFYLVTSKNRWGEILNLFHNLRHHPEKAARTLLMDNTYIQLVIKHPQLVYICFLLLAGDTKGSDVSRFLMVWMAAGILAFFLTSLRRLLFLGEADRYLEYILFPQLVFIGLSGGFFPFAWCMAGYGVLLYIIFASIFVFQYSKKAQDSRDFEKLVSFFKQARNMERVLPVYLNDALELAYESGKRIAHFPGNFRNEFFPYREFLSFYEKVYPFPSENLPRLMNRYGFDVLYYSEEDMKKAAGHGLHYDLSGWHTLFSNAKYRVLAPPRATGGRSGMAGGFSPLDDHDSKRLKPAAP